MKTIIICADGSAKTIKSMTNAGRLARAVRCESMFYLDGVGTEPGNLILGNVVGRRVDDNVLQCYEFIAMNYEEGDKVILIGYSRGAYTIRSLAGLIYNSGVPRKENVGRLDEAMDAYRSKHKPSSEKMVEFRKGFGDRIPIELMICFDTVGSIVGQSFHDTVVNKDVKQAVQFAAFDEDRRAFELTYMSGSNTKTYWYNGDHGCIGGTNEDYKKLSNCSLRVAINYLEKCGVKIMISDFEFDANMKFKQKMSPLVFFTSLLGKCKRHPGDGDVILATDM